MITGTVVGESVDAVHKGWFDVAGYEFELESLVSGTSGTPVFLPLFIDLEGSLSSGVTALLGAAALGTTTPTVTFAARKAGATTDYATIPVAA